MAYELTIPCVDFVKKIIFVFKAYSDLVNWLEPQGGGGGIPIWNRRGCSSEIFNLTPKGDHPGRGSSFLRPLKETNLGVA